VRSIFSTTFVKRLVTKVFDLVEFVQRLKDRYLNTQ
jgi:hypothetical protein